MHAYLFEVYTHTRAEVPWRLETHCFCSLSSLFQTWCLSHRGTPYTFVEWMMNKWISVHSSLHGPSSPSPTGRTGVLCPPSSQAPSLKVLASSSQVMVTFPALGRLNTYRAYLFTSWQHSLLYFRHGLKYFLKKIQNKQRWLSAYLCLCLHC